MAAKAGSAAQPIVHAIEGLFKSLTSLLGHAKTEPADPAAPPANGKTPTELADIAGLDKGFEDAMQDLRNDLGAFGKSIGTIATGIITALGYTRFNDIFPFPLGAPGWLGPAAVAAALCGLGGTTFLIFRFFFAKRRILILPPKELSAPWWRGERRVIIRMTQPYAESENLPSLDAVEQKRLGLLKTAHAEQPAGATDTAEWKEAYRLERVVDLALWDASNAVLERRTRGAFGGPVATVAIVLAVGGIGFTFAVADWAKGRRTLPEQRAREAQVCVKQARTTGSTALVKACIAKATADLSK